MDTPARSLIEDASRIVGRCGGFSFGGMQPAGVTATRPLPPGTIFPNRARAAALLTFDVEGRYGNGLGDVEREIDNYKRICDRLHHLGLVATFNVVGQMVDDYGGQFVRWMLEAGCEVAGHGYWHDLNRRFGGTRVYAGQYGPEENFLQLSKCLDALNAAGAAVRGIRLPYGHFNEFSYEAMEHLDLAWSSNVGIDDYVVPGQGFGSQPFTMTLSGKTYPVVEIPLDSQTYDWSIWMADEKENSTFVEAVRRYCREKSIPFERTPAGAVTVWKQRIADAMATDTVMTLLCHPTNLAVPTLAEDALETFLFPVMDHLAALQSEGRLWVCTCGRMAEFYSRT